MSSGQPGAGEERRQFFRIADQVLVAFRPLDADGVDEAAARARVARADRGALAVALDDLTAHLQRVLQGLDQGHPQVAEALRLLDRKVTLLAAAGDAAGGAPDLVELQVSLSAGGMALPAAGPVPSGALLEIDLVLLPDYEYLKLFGRVTDCRPREAGYVLGVAFEGVKEIQRERIIRHVFSAQARALRTRGS